MPKQNSKPSFSIDDILCQRTSVASVSSPTVSSYTTNTSVLGFSDDLNIHTAAIPSLLSFIPSRYYFSNHHSQPAHIDPYYNPFQKVMPNNFMPYYSHPLDGYIFPGCTFKRKGGQVRFTPQQTQNLEQEFKNHKYLSPEDRKKLAIHLKLSDRQVKTWFQNRRAKHRRTSTSILASSTNGNSMCKDSPMQQLSHSLHAPVNPICISSEEDYLQCNQIAECKTKSKAMGSNS